MRTPIVLRVALLTFFFIGILGCGPRRPPVPIGEVPTQSSVSMEDEEYGQEVFRELSQQYVLDNNDARINRVRTVVDRLTTAAGVARNPWHVHVFDDDEFANAAATRGNFIFVWSGIFRDIHSDDEIAAILAHELAHVLAGHTAPNPVEEVQRIIAGVAGDVAAQVVAVQGPYGALAELAALVVRSMLEAAIVNPGQQEDELEADQVGLFIMADAGYDPRAAYDFWDRVKDLPGYEGNSISIFSSHPSNEDRLAQISALLPPAIERFERAKKQSSPASPAQQSSPSRKKTSPDASHSSEWVWN